jgi:hypothetical protein
LLGGFLDHLCVFVCCGMWARVCACVAPLAFLLYSVLASSHCMTSSVCPACMCTVGAVQRYSQLLHGLKSQPSPCYHLIMRACCIIAPCSSFSLAVRTLRRCCYLVLSMLWGGGSIVLYNACCLRIVGSSGCQSRCFVAMYGCTWPL